MLFRSRYCRNYRRFPESATVTTYTNEELESTENIHYQWNEKGALLFSKQECYTADGTLEVSVATSYSEAVPLAPVLIKTDAQSYVTEIAYSYDSNGRLKISNTQPAGNR